MHLTAFKNIEHSNVPKLLRLAFCLIFIILHPLGLSAQSESNAGTEFWATFPSHEPDIDKSFNPLLANISIFITSAQASAGTITAGAFSQTFTIAANTVTEIKVPREAAYINDTESGTVLSNRAIHILVNPGQPKVVAYAHIFAGQRSAATLLLPKEALGQQYYSINYQQYEDEGHNYITVVATEPNTKIHIKRGNVELVPGGVTLNNTNDVYQYLSDDDLTGVSVSVDAITSACKRFAMFSGSTGVYITKSGCDPKSIDPLYQQCYPIDSWGNSYGVIPFSMTSPNFTMPVRTAGQFVRVLAKDDNTIVTINGNTVATLQSGQYYTTPQPIQTASYLTASNAVCVAQYPLSQSCSNSNPQIGNTPNSYSDPDMVILNPIAFNIKNITVYSSTKENITEQYINILIKTSAAASFKINGQPPTAQFAPMPTLPDYSYLQLNLNSYQQNTFTLTANESFNAIAYGLGNVESYAYSAGTNLAATHSLVEVNSTTNQVIDTACTNEDFVFQLTLPYQSPQISWKMDDGENAVIQLSPVAITSVKNGQTSYVYSFPKTPAYQNPGIHHILINAYYPNTIGGCSTGYQVIDESFFTISPPTVDFSATPEDCENVIDFKDLSTDPGKKIVAWLWDFNDSSKGSTAQNPSHQFANAGQYQVSLNTISSTGCQSSITKTITVTRSISLNADISTPNCVGKPVYFTDKSTATGFVTYQRKWFFGNGDSIVTQDEVAKYLYKQPGDYTVKMVLVTAQGCESDTLRKLIKIYAMPLPNFGLPPACVSDVVTFVNKTPGNNYQYLWNFGDSNSINPNTSTSVNPVHQYSNPQLYNVSLTVISPGGCDTTLIQTLTINGGTPVADFDIINSNTTCVNEAIVLKNKSKVVEFGSITKLEWYFQISGHPTYKQTVTSLSPDNIYSYHLPFTDITTNTNCKIALEAYSGTTCSNVLSNNIILSPLPKVKFGQLSPVCINASPLQLTQGAELTGINGDGGKYYGAGVSATGVFNPVVAGLGTHLIKYTFTSANGCADSLTNPISVIAEPTVNIADKIYVLPNQTTILKPQYGGKNLKYKWEPATGLSSDTIAYPTVKPIKDITNYKVTISNGNCSNAASVDVIMLKPPVIYNTFTPNSDGVNDKWDILNLDMYQDALIEVFNRYGQQVYRSIGYTKAWDGKYQGADVPAGIYYYVINLQRGLKPLTGFVLVVR